MEAPLLQDLADEIKKEIQKIASISEPSQPKELTIYKEKVSKTSIMLSWKEPDPSDLSIIGYEVECRKNGGDFTKVEKVLTREDLACEVTELAANTEYEFRVAAINLAGCGPFTDPVAQFTKPSQPNGLSICKNKITESSITLSWEEPDLSGVSIVGYEVEHRKTGDENFKKMEKSEDLSYEVIGLAANTEYEFRVAAINIAGCGPYTDCVAQFTKPSQPKEFTVYKDKTTTTSITLSWKEPDPSGGHIIGYEVEYRKAGKNFKKVEKSLACEDLTYEVIGLTPNTEYEFRVAAINTAGCGPFTDIAAEFTRRKMNYTLVILIFCPALLVLFAYLMNRMY